MLLGEIALLQSPHPQRHVLVLVVGGVGYEMQIVGRWATQLQAGEHLQVFTHLQIREEQPLLYGFATPAERDLFRQLIAVTGIGPQSALALLDALGLEVLVQSIVTSDVRQLSCAPGVGRKTAERLALELRSKLSSWRTERALPLPDGEAFPWVEEVELTLVALGYGDREIAQALAALAQDPDPDRPVEEWIRRGIAWLSA